MTVVVALGDLLVADQDGAHWASGNIPYRQTLPAGTVITWGWNSGLKASGDDDFDADLYDVQTGSPVSLRAGAQHWTGVGVGGASYSVTLSSSADAALILFAGGASGHHSAGTLYGFHAEAVPPGGFCDYGTRLQTGQHEVIILSEAVIAAAALIVPELALFAVVWTAFVGWTFVPGLACASGPPDIPSFTNADFLFGSQVPAPGSIPKFWTALQAALWRIYCECAPGPGGGAPDPVPYPPPTVALPPSGIPLPPAPITCDAADICSTLNAIVSQMRAMSAQITYARADIQLIQRQEVPFAYVAGTVHSGLAAQGDFAVQGILGLAVNMSGVVPTGAPGDPVTYHQVGKVTTGTADGWQRSWEPTHNPYIILDVSGATTRVGYSFPPGVTATITELVREP